MSEEEHVVSIFEQFNQVYSSEKEQLLVQLGKAFDEILDDWNSVNVLGRQWILRDFEKHLGLSADVVSAFFAVCISDYKSNVFDNLQDMNELLRLLRNYFSDLIVQMQGYVNDQRRIIKYVAPIKSFISILDNSSQGTSREYFTFSL